MTKIKRFVATAMAFLMIVGSMSVLGYAWDANVDDGFNLGIKTEILRNVGTAETPDWVPTRKVVQGEDVKARVYLDTDYFTNNGTLLFFYNNDFFEDSYGTENALTISDYYSNAPYSAKGKFFTEEANPYAEQDLVDYELIDQIFADEHNSFTVIYEFGVGATNKYFDGSKWFCQFDLKVKDDAYGTGDFFAVEETALGTSRDAQNGIIDVPKGPSTGIVANVVSMANWDADLDFESYDVSLYTTFATANFDANGGKFADGKSTATVSGESGDEIDLDAPTKNGYTFLGWAPVNDPENYSAEVLIPDTDTDYIAVWANAYGDGNELKFKTEFYRYDENAEGEDKWVYTEKVKPGEDVVARIFIDTSYATNAGDIIAFFDKDFFVDNYEYLVSKSIASAPAADHSVVAFNDSATGSAKINEVNGSFLKLKNANGYIVDMIDNGSLDQDFVDSHVAMTINYTYTTSTAKPISGEEWFVEIPLTVSSSASGTGWYLIVDDTIANTSEEGIDNYINIPVCVEGSAAGTQTDLWTIDVLHEVENNPVSTYSSITFQANGGAFDAEDTDEYLVEGDIGDAVDAEAIPALTKDGAEFKGWYDAEIAEPTEADLVDVPSEIPHDDLVLKAFWVDRYDYTFHFNNGDEDLVVTATAGDPFEAVEEPALEGNYFIGWTTDDTLSTITGLPEVYPSEATDYYAVFSTSSYPVKYYVFALDDSGFTFAGSIDTSYGDPIKADPITYEVPEGYSLSEAYTDISLTTPLEDGATMPANEVSLYYKLLTNEYEAKFYIDPEDVGVEEPYATVTTKFDSKIAAPADPEKEGYDFLGWEPGVGYMDTEGKTFVATWEAKEYKATFVVDGVEDVYPLRTGDEMETPADPYKEGYEFKGWSPEVPDVMPGEDVTYTAVFEAKEFDAIFNAGEGAFADEESEAVVPTAFGEAIDVPEDPTREGYVFAGWEPEIPDTMPAEALEFEAKWDPATDTPYTIVIYKMGTDGEYDDGTTYNKTGVTEQTATYEPIVTEGFYIEETDAHESVLSAEILPDGSTELVVYLARESYDIEFLAAGGKFSDGSSSVADKYYYGAAVVAPEDPERTGFTFKGWDKNVAETALADATYTATWDANVHTLTYLVDGEEFKVEEYNYGEEIVSLEDDALPTKTGYTFQNWDNEVPETMGDEDVELNAVFAPKTYDATFDANGGEFADGTDSKTVPTEFDSDIALPDEPTKEGYEFGGWSVDGETPVDPGTMDTEGGEDYVALWTPAAVGYVVNYFYMDVDGNYPEDPDNTVSVLDAVTDSEAKVEPEEVEGFTLDAENEDLVLSATVAADGSTALAVYYKRNIKTLTIDKNDGSEPETKEYYVGAEVDDVADPEKEGYDFAGWSEDIPETMPNEDVNAVAQWEAKKYNVTYIKDGETYYGPIEVEFGKERIPEPAVPSKVGFIFSKWSETTDDKKPSDYESMPAKDLEFEAIFIANANVGYKLEVYEMDTEGNYPEDPTTVYTFTNGVVGETASASVTAPAGFEVDLANSVLSGTIPADPDDPLILKEYLTRNVWVLTVSVEDEADVETEYYYQEEVEAVADPVKEGFVFTGWVNEDEEPVKVPVTMPNNDVHIIATFEKDAFMAAFDANGGEFSNGDDTFETPVVFGEDIPTPPVPEKEGYEFKGWAKESDPETVVDSLGKMDADGENFVAVWEVESYTVKFYDYIVAEHKDISQGTAYVYSEGEVEFGTEIEFPAADPEIKNFVFTGWADNDGNPVEPGVTMPAADVSYYATYERVKVALIPKTEDCTTQIERDDTINDTDKVDDYTETSEWFVYGLKEKLTEEKLLEQFIDVQGDGYIVVKLSSAKFAGTGSVIEVYDYVTGQLVEKFWVVIFGDIDGNGAVRAVDVSMCEDETIGLTSWSRKSSDSFVSYMFKAADVDGNGRIKTADGSIINDHTLGAHAIDQVTGRQAV